MYTLTHSLPAVRTHKHTLLLTLTYTHTRTLTVTYALKYGLYVTLPLIYTHSHTQDAVTRSQYIAQALLYGDNRKHCIVVIVPDFAEIKQWAKKTHPAIFGTYVIRV